jgi:hypothetical protein
MAKKKGPSEPTMSDSDVSRIEKAIQRGFMDKTDVRVAQSRIKNRADFNKAKKSFSSAVKNVERKKRAAARKGKK